MYKYVKWLSFVVIALLLVGCSNTDKPKEQAKPEPAKSITSYTVKDDRGVEVTFDKVPQTIISMQPSNTEILFALGVGDKIIGVTEYDEYPKEALEIERIGSTLEFNGERILELNPDVVVAYDNAPEETIQLLEDAGLKVFVLASSESVADVYENIEKIAQVVQAEDKGQSLIADIQAKIEEVKKVVATVETPKNVYFEISPAPSIYTTGSGTFQQELLQLANVKNVFSDLESWVQISEEQVITKNPEVILSSVADDKNVDAILGRAGWDQITAVQNKDVFYVDKSVTSRPGPRIGEALEMIAKTVYPELFK